MKKRGYLILSVILSLVFHGVLIASGDRIRFRDFASYSDETQRSVRVGTINLRDRVMQRPSMQELQNKAEEQLRDAVRNSEKIEGIFEAEALAVKPKPKLRLAGLGRNIREPDLPKPEAPRAATAPRPKILEIDAATVPRERLALERPFRSKVARIPMGKDDLPSLLAPGALQGGVGRTFDVGMRLAGLSGAAGLNVPDLPPDQGTGEDALRREGMRTGMAPRAPAPGLPGINPTIGSGGDGSGGSAGSRTLGDGETIREFEKFVNVNVAVYDAPREGRYFRVDISPNPRSDILREVPKDILFLVDSSASISGAKLEQFKASSLEALQYLNPHDRFNVVSFTVVPNPVFEDYVPVNQANVAKAAAHLRSLTRGGMTDVFASLAPYVSEADPTERRKRPLNIFLLTDGKTTVSGKLTNEEFVRQIVSSQKENGLVSIYPFSAGKSANLPLLDFLAYHNRGLSLHVQNLKDFERTLLEYISTHSSLILMDLNVQATGGAGEEIYPQRLLPHVYRGETLSLFGRVPEGADELVLSVFGRQGEARIMDLVVRRKIEDTRVGNSGIAEDWAAQKIFHLIGQQILDPSDENDRQIRSLAERYGLYIPY